MRLCGSGLRQPTDRPLLPAALYCLMLYVFELMANASLNRGLASPIKEPNVLSATVSETTTVLLRFL
jgi:hypothetical protein